MKLSAVIVGLTFLLFNTGYSLATENIQAGSLKNGVKTEISDDVKFCLICGPEEESEALSFSYTYKGKKYLFCSMECLKAFKKDPGKYLTLKAT